jgi:Zn finger protein HypA/HybF involved in hydrogenase expression
MSTFRIECEECDNETIVDALVHPQFCPVCGRRGEVENIDDTDLVEDLDFDND